MQQMEGVDEEMIIAPSVLSADYTQLKKEMTKLNRSKADWIHYDVMDGHFVPNLSFGPDILKAINRLSDKFIDVHIMVDNPLKTIEYFSGCRIDLMTFHYEAAADNLHEVMSAIKDKGWKCGISVKPATDVRVLNEILDQVDLVLIMSVEPGFGGQKFMADMLEKVRYLADFRQNHQLDYLIEIDGGINGQTGAQARAAGCDVLVAGSYLFKHPDGLEKGVETLL